MIAFLLIFLISILLSYVVYLQLCYVEQLILNAVKVPQITNMRCFTSKAGLSYLSSESAFAGNFLINILLHNIVHFYMALADSQDPTPSQV